MKNKKILALVMASIGLLGAVFFGFNTDSRENIAFAASITNSRVSLLKSLNQNISDVTIKSNNTDKTIGKIGDVITLNYTLNKIPTKNTVLIDYQTITPVCERDVLVQKCSAAVLITKLFPINDGIVDFSIDVTFKDGKSENKTIVDDKTFVDVQRGNSTTAQAIIDEKAAPLAVSTAPTLASVLKLNTISGNQGKTSITTKASPDQLKTVLEKRKEIMIFLAKSRPQEYIYGMFPTEIAKKLSTSFPDLIEKNVAETGILEVIHVDDFENEKNSYFIYQLRQGEKVIPLYSVEDLNRTSGDVVTINGSKIGNSLVIKSTKQIQILNKPEPITTKDEPDSVGRQNTLVFLIRFPDSRPIPFSRRAAHRMIFAGQFQKFYKEQSYNKTSFSGRVMDWITLDYSITGAGICRYGSNVTLENPTIENAIINNNIQLSEYSRVLFLVEEAGGGCSTVGESSVFVDNVLYRVSQSWVGTNDYQSNAYTGTHPFSWTNLDILLAHEMGHAIGVYHANGWECGETSLRGDCEHVEYGNHYDTMGGAAFSLHFNAFYKELLGWIKPSETEIITRPGTYTIKPLENILFRFLFNNNQVKRFAKIKTMNSDKTPFYLEYRKPLGFDKKLSQPEFISNTKGLLINYVINEPWTKYPRLLDMTPHKVDNNTWENNYFDDTKNVTLNGNNTFTDPDTGITVGPVIQNTNTKITFNVGITDPICIRRIPSIREIQVGGSSGYDGYVYVNFYNTDSVPCGSSEFIIENVTLPSGWVYQTQYYSFDEISPENYGYKSIIFNIPTTALVGTVYPISFDLVNRVSGMRKSIQTTIQVQ